jgi:hypothetical protein
MDSLENSGRIKITNEKVVNVHSYSKLKREGKE